jgi:hypothetical protein
MDDSIKEAFKLVCFKPPTNTAEMACWYSYAKSEGKGAWTVFKKLGINSKTISRFKTRWEEGLSNHQRKKWSDYERQYQTEVRYIISLC